MGVKVTHEIRQMVEALTDEMLAQLTHARHKGGQAGRAVGHAWGGTGCAEHGLCPMAAMHRRAAADPRALRRGTALRLPQAALRRKMCPTRCTA